MIHLYILKGQEPVRVHSIAEWGRWFETSRGQRNVEQTRLPGGVRVSTVFIGVDHGFRDDDRPLIFETMIFGGPHDQEMDRCSTWQEAIAMHHRMCALAKLGMVQLQQGQQS